MTTEAGCAKGVLHRHFADFDTFLAELVMDRIGRIGIQSAALRDAAGTATLAGNLTDALMLLFEPLAREILGLVVSRHALLARLRPSTPTGIPVLTQGAAMIASYLTAEMDLGRLASDADVGMLAATLIGVGHMLLAGREGTPPEREAVHKAVATVIAGAAVA